VLSFAIVGQSISEPNASRTTKPLAKESMNSGSPENRTRSIALFLGPSVSIREITAHLLLGPMIVIGALFKLKDLCRLSGYARQVDPKANEGHQRFRRCSQAIIPLVCNTTITTAQPHSPLSPTLTINAHIRPNAGAWGMEK
jgi:hypothetical protein